MTIRNILSTDNTAGAGIARLLAEQRDRGPGTVSHDVEHNIGTACPVAEIQPPGPEHRRVCFLVHAVPVAQPRQRHRIAGSGPLAFVQNYTPTKHPVNDFKASVRMAFSAACNWTWTGPVTVSIVAVFPRPKSKTKKRGPNLREPKTSKPDWDNIGKSVCDALTGLAWNDDAQIVGAAVKKYIAAGDEQAHVAITIEG